MIFRIHYIVECQEDSFVVTGDNLDDISQKVDEFFTKRGLSPDDVEAWSEELHNA